jgi:hypothetical protein
MNPVAPTAAGYAGYGDTLLNRLSVKAGVTGATPFDVPILMPAIYLVGTMEGGTSVTDRGVIVVKTSL